MQAECGGRQGDVECQSGGCLVAAKRKSKLRWGCFVLYAWVALSCRAKESMSCSKQKVAAALERSVESTSCSCDADAHRRKEKRNRKSEDVDVDQERATQNAQAVALARVSVELQVAGQRGKSDAHSRLRPSPKCRCDRRLSCANWPHYLLALAYNHKSSPGSVDNASNPVLFCNEDPTPASPPMTHLSPRLSMSSLSLFALVVENMAGVC